MSADIPRVEEIGVDRWVLGFTLASRASSRVWGSGRCPRFDVALRRAGSLKAEERGSSASFGRAAGLLVVGEVAVAVMLAIGAGLLIRSFAELLRVDPGFRAERLVTARITPPESRYGDDARRRAFYGELLERIGALPGVQSVEATSHLPLVGGSGGFAFEVEGKPYVEGTGAPVTGEHIVTPGYLETMGIPLLAGRGLAQSDREHAPAVAVSTRRWRASTGRERIRSASGSSACGDNDWITVVGVVGDVKYDGLASTIEPEIYRPFLQAPAANMSLVVRAAHDPTAVAAASARPWRLSMRPCP